MPKMKTKWVVLCTAAVGAIYGAEYYATDVQAFASVQDQLLAGAESYSNAAPRSGSPIAGSGTDGMGADPASEAPATASPLPDATESAAGAPSPAALPSATPGESPVAGSPAGGKAGAVDSAGSSQAPQPPSGATQTPTQPPTKPQTQPPAKSPTQPSTQPPTKNASPSPSPSPTPSAVPSPSPSPSSDAPQASDNPAASEANRTYKDGAYTGRGSNRRGSIEVTVTIRGDKIADVTISRFAMHYSESDVVDLPDEVVQLQSAEVKNVSGATYSTRAFADAVQEALDQARNA